MQTKQQRRIWLWNLCLLFKEPALLISILAFLAAAWQGYIANDYEKRQLRAYVGVHQAGSMGLQDDGPIGVGFNFINHGQTPAQKVNLIGVIDVLPYPLPPEYVLADAPPRPTQDGVIFPNETPPMVGWVWLRDTVDTPTKTELFSVNPNRTIYAHGVITYDDIFGAHRRTEFCYFLSSKSIERDTNGIILRDKDGYIKFQWGPCAGYNKVY